MGMGVSAGAIEPWIWLGVVGVVVAVIVLWPRPPDDPPTGGPGQGVNVKEG
jgi:hypothetical protein